MRELKKRLFIASITLLVAVAMLATATLAWMTISTKPEVSVLGLKFYTARTLLLSTDGEHFYEYISLEEKFEGRAPLKPVSTIDGLYWFIPQYEATGDLKDPNAFIVDKNWTQQWDTDASDYHYANILLTDQMTSLEYYQAQQQAYYVWTDIWIRSEEENGCKVRVSIPHTIDPTELPDKTNNTNNFGTYVMPEFARVPGEEDAIEDQSLNVESSIRVGFLVFEDGDENEDEPTNFIIFEPNADKRSAKEVKPGATANPDTTVYVHDYIFNDDAYDETIYYETLPLQHDWRPVVWGDAPDGTNNCLVQDTSSFGTEMITIGGEEVETISVYDINFDTYRTLYKKVVTAEPESNNKNYVFASADDLIPDPAPENRILDRDNQTYYKYTRTDDIDGNPYIVKFEVDTRETKQYFASDNLCIKLSDKPSNVETDTVSFLNYRLETEGGFNSSKSYYKKNSDTGVFEAFTLPEEYGFNAEDGLYVKVDNIITQNYQDLDHDYYRVITIDDLIANPENKVLRLQETVDGVTKDVKYFVDGGHPQTIDPTKLIVQQKCIWDTEKLKAVLNPILPLTSESKYIPDSNTIKTFGSFLKTESLYNELSESGTGNDDPESRNRYIKVENANGETTEILVEKDIASDTLVLNLPDTTPVKIRVFIWMEGQDVDCWNDIAGGSFVVNIELAGETHPPPAVEDTEE